MLFIDNNPNLKKSLKILFGGLIKYRNLKNIRLYNNWLNQNCNLGDNDIQAQQLESEKFEYKPLISIITPIYNTPIAYFNEMVESVLKQTYSNWELVLIDDASSDNNIRNTIKEVAKNDQRIKYKFLTTNHHIAGATNEGIKIANGEFISLLDHDDILQKNALFEVVSSLNSNHDIDFIYTDEDKLYCNGNYRSDPFFKPDWNPDLLHSINYITHFTTIRKLVLDKFGYEDGSYNGAQDWELFLRIIRNIPKKNIHHIPKILYSWRVHESSTAMTVDSKPYVIEAQFKAIKADLDSSGYINYDLRRDDKYPGQWRVLFKLNKNPKVSIIVFEDTVDFIMKNTDYDNFEVKICYKNSSVFEVLNKISGDYVVVVDKKINIDNRRWLEILIGDAIRHEIGFVVAGDYENRLMLDNMRVLLDKPIFSYLKKLNNKELSRHYYSTSRYNIPNIPSQSVYAIGVEKVDLMKSEINNEINFAELSIKMNSRGLYNLYNPCVKL